MPKYKINYVFLAAWQQDSSIQINCNYYWEERKGKKKELPGLLIRLEVICRIQNAQIQSNTEWVYTEYEANKVHQHRNRIPQASMHMLSSDTLLAELKSV